MEFPAHLSFLEKMIAYIRQEASQGGAQEEIILKIELACEEALVNIISYAYSQKTGMVSIHCRQEGNLFEIALSDQGKYFNPIAAQIDPQLHKPVEERSIGGLGIYLLLKAIDEASYERVGNANVLRLRFAL